MSSRNGSALIAALISPLVILAVATAIAVAKFRTAQATQFDAATLYFPDPRNPLEYIVLLGIYAMPAAWLMMLFAVPAFLIALRHRVASWWVSAGFGAVAGALVAAVLGAPAYASLLTDGVIYGVAVGVTFWWVERWLWQRLRPDAQLHAETRP